MPEHLSRRSRLVRKGGKASHKNSNRRTRMDSCAIALTMIVLLGLFLSLFFFYGPSPINGDDNYAYADLAYQVYSGHGSVLLTSGPFGVKYLLIYGIALFYLLAGPGVLGAALYGVVCFLFTIVVVYAIGKELGGRRTGLLGAFFYAVTPMAVINSSNVGDSTPLALFVSVAVLLLVMARRRGSQPLYALSGIFSVVSFLVSAEGVIIAVPILLIALADLLMHRDKKRLVAFASLFVGALIGVGIIALAGFAQSGDLMRVYKVDSSQYLLPYTGGRFNNYLGWLFPYAVGPSSVPIQDPLGAYLHIASDNPFNYLSGYVAYSAVIAAIYLIGVRERRALVPAVWAVSTFLYLSFGTMSLTSYVPIQATSHYTIIFMPALAIIIAMAVARATERVGDSASGKAVLALTIALSVVLAYSSVQLIIFNENSQHNYVLPLIQTADFVDSAPPAQVYASVAVPISVYFSYARTLQNIPARCTDVPPGDYVIMKYNQSFWQGCDAVVAYRAIEPPWLAGYTLFAGSGFGNFYNETVYIRGGTPQEQGVSKTNECTVVQNHTESMFGPCDTVIFLPGTHNNSLTCSGPLSNVTFLKGSSNNTVSNCTIAHVDELDSGLNFVLGAMPQSYNVSGASSGLGVGYYMRFVPHLSNGSIQTSFPNIIMVTSLSGNIPAMNRTFDHYYGVASVPIETLLIRGNGTINYNPYRMVAPDWGWDVLSTRVVNVTSNFDEVPNFIRYTNITNFEIFPDSTPIWWNFTVTPYQSGGVQPMLLSGVQNTENATIVKVFPNVTTSALMRYRIGVQRPGLYTYTPMLVSRFEVDNSSAETYSVGLSYCNVHDYAEQPNIGVLDKPGYYSFAGRTLYRLFGPWLKNDIPCGVGAIVRSNSVTVDCRGGSVNATYASFYVVSSKNVTIQNCMLYGNGIHAINSSVTIKNTTFSGNPQAQSFALYAQDSNVITSGFIVHLGGIINDNSTIT